MIRPVIETAWKGQSLDNPDLPKWAKTLDSVRNHLKKRNEYTSQILSLTIPSGTQRKGYVIRHNLGYTPFVEVYAKGGGDSDFSLVPAILTGTSEVNIFVAITQGTNETVINFYNPDIFNPLSSNETVKFKYTINIDPSKDAWDS